MANDPAPVADGSTRVGALAVSRVRPAYRQVEDQLLGRIRDGSLAVGDRLPSEAELSALFGVSRGTVREALRGLASRNLVHTARGPEGGTVVRQVEIGEVSEFLAASLGLMSSSTISVDDMLEAREILEVPAARLAAERRDQDQLDAMREAMERERVARGRGSRFTERRNFHAVVVECAGNAVLGAVAEPVYRVLQTKFLDPTMEVGLWGRVDAEHEAILAAIADGDADRAARTMRDHLRGLRDAYRSPH